MEKEKRDQKKR